MVLYGHSMGGLVVLGYLLTDRPRPDLVVLSSPALDSTLAEWKKTLAPTLSRIVPTLAIPNGIDGRTLSRDPAVADKVGADPLATKASTTRFGAEALAEQARVRRDYAGLTLPTLVLHGLDDGLVPPQASEILGHAPERGAPDLPGPAPRAPQRAGGTRDRRRDHRLDQGQGGRPCYDSRLTEYRLRGARVR